MAKDYHSWERIDGLVRSIVERLNADDYDAILAITRGGMIPGGLISKRLLIRDVLTAAVMFYTDGGQTFEKPVFLQFPIDTLVAGKRILIVDDVWDSGKTAVAVKERVVAAGGTPTVAVIHYKPKASRFPDQRPDFYALETDAWIVYPWEPDYDERPGNGS